MDKSYQESYYYNRMKDEKLKKRFLRDKRRCFLMAIIATFLAILIYYFMTEASNIYKIAVHGNRLLSEDTIVQLAEISTDNKYWLVFSPGVSERIRRHELIEKVRVKHENGNVISIEVTEKEAFAYCYRDGNTYLWAEGGAMILLDKSSLSFLGKVPLIEGYTAEQFVNLEKSFRELSSEMLGEISEIHRYPMTYDENYMEVIMRDGNYVFLSPLALKYLNSYYSVASGIGSDKNLCLYFDDVTGTGYSSACPWQAPAEELNPSLKVEEENS